MAPCRVAGDGLLGLLPLLSLEVLRLRMVVGPTLMPPTPPANCETGREVRGAKTRVEQASGSLGAESFCRHRMRQKRGLKRNKLQQN